MKKCIAIPLENDILCPHFGHCQKFALVDVENNKTGNYRELVPPEHQPGLYPKWIAEYGVTDVIAGGIGQKAINLFNDFHINVFAGAPIKGPRELVEDFLEDRLELNANYCDH